MKIIRCLFALLLFVAQLVPNAHAEGTDPTIYFDGTIYLDGKRLELSQEHQPILRNGSNYLPVTTLAEPLDKQAADIEPSIEIGGVHYAPLRIAAEASGCTVEWFGGADCRIELLSPEFKTVLESFLIGGRVDYSYRDGIVGYLGRRYPYGGKLMLDFDFSGDWPRFYIELDELAGYIERDAVLRDEIRIVNARLITPEMSAEDKLLAINDYICANYSYDYAEKKDRTVYEAWFSDVVTCTGYARIFEAMATEAGD